MRRLFASLALAALLSPAARADDSPLERGSYVGLLGSQFLSDADAVADNSQGGALLLGLRRGGYSLEAALLSSRADGSRQRGGSLSGLLFPLHGREPFSGLYAVAGVGAVEIKGYPGVDERLGLTTVEGGFGYLLPLRFSGYHLGLRVEGRYRYARREKELNLQQQDLDIPRAFQDQSLSVGVQLPLGRPAPSAPPAQRVSVALVPAPP